MISKEKYFPKLAKEKSGQNQQICLNIYVLMFQVLKYFVSYLTKCSFRREDKSHHD